MKSIAKEYLLLFNVITDTEEALRALQCRLVEAQQRAEALYLGETEPNTGEISQSA